MRAVLWDMDGTLVDSEKLWDISLQALYERLGGVLSEEIRASTVGGAAETVIQIVFDDLGLDPHPRAMTAAADWVHDHTGTLFESGLPWCEGARDLLDELAVERVPMALVTNTRRALTESALNSIGREYFSATVCADEVTNAKPAPDSYRRAAALLGLEPHQCLAIEDSITGAAAAEDAGCAVLVVPNEVSVPMTPRRRSVTSLNGLDVASLRTIFRELKG
ncbi:MAG: HAD family phosphatase [Actinomycetia bacterium]|nr:HAD family phosphatase [Actinomycetes bacterium]